MTPSCPPFYYSTYLHITDTYKAIALSHALVCDCSTGIHHNAPTLAVGTASHYLFPEQAGSLGGGVLTRPLYFFISLMLPRRLCMDSHLLFIGGVYKADTHASISVCGHRLLS